MPAIVLTATVNIMHSGRAHSFLANSAVSRTEAPGPRFATWRVYMSYTSAVGEAHGLIETAGHRVSNPSNPTIAPISQMGSSRLNAAVMGNVGATHTEDMCLPPAWLGA